MEILMQSHLPSFSSNYALALLASIRPSDMKLWGEGQEVVAKNRLVSAVKKPRLRKPARTASRLVRDCMLSLSNLGRYNKVSLLWVPAHVGIPANEKAVSMAKEGTKLAISTTMK